MDGEVTQTSFADSLVCLLTDPDLSFRVIFITEEPQCLAAHWRTAHAAAGIPDTSVCFSSRQFIEVNEIFITAVS